MLGRTEEGKSKREIIRCLKRYIARELYRVLNDDTEPFFFVDRHRSLLRPGLA